MDRLRGWGSGLQGAQDVVVGAVGDSFRSELEGLGPAVIFFVGDSERPLGSGPAVKDEMEKVHPDDLTGSPPAANGELVDPGGELGWGEAELAGEADLGGPVEESGLDFGLALGDVTEACGGQEPCVPGHGGGGFDVGDVEGRNGKLDQVTGEADCPEFWGHHDAAEANDVAVQAPGPGARSVNYVLIRGGEVASGRVEVGIAEDCDGRRAVDRGVSENVD